MRFITANSIFSGKEYLPNHTVMVIENGSILDLISLDALDPLKVEHVEGMICPGFVNAHCHLELSHLKNKIPRHTGIVDFGLGIIKSRNDLPVEFQLECMQQADKEMRSQGIVAVGDISNSGLSIDVKGKSSLYYHTFIELIGLNPQRLQIIMDAGKRLLAEYQAAGLSASLAPHAPYSVSLQLIEAITKEVALQKKSTSIHNQESLAENEFFLQASGDYLRLYETLHLPIDYFKATGKSSLQTVISSFHPDVSTLLVHNTFTSQVDIEDARRVHPHLFWCLCPQANLYIENRLPDVNMLRMMNCKFALGTDSLASNSGLSVLAEINCLLEQQNNLNLEDLLRAACYDGALSLGLDETFGLIAKGRKPGINILKEKRGVYSLKVLD